VPRLSARSYARLTTGVTWAVAVIIVTGGAVRLTGSGLGCPDWPTCTQDRLVAEWDYHQMVEFVNRVVTGAVSIAVILAVLGAWIRVPRRRDLVMLGCGLVAGVIGQIVLGGITVLFDLAPALVASHLLLSLAILTAAVVLHDRASQPDTAPRPAVPDELANLGRILLVAATLVVVTGTVVTGSGPHAGDPKAHRFSFTVSEVARVHGTSVMLFLALALAAVVMLRRAGAPATTLRRATVLLAVIVAQAAVGYTQYFTGVPALLVGVHIAGATAVWVATVRLHLGLFVRPPVAQTETIDGWPEPRPSSLSAPTSVGTPSTTRGPSDHGSSSSGTIRST
jgi:heme a synthase